MKRITSAFAPLLLLAMATGLAGCAQLISYKEPTEGPIARVRLIGNQPELYTTQCDGEDAKPKGFAYYGGKRHDLHMPNPPTETSDTTEYYVVADKHLAVSFGDPSLIPPKGYQVRYSGERCNYTQVVFIPKPGHDYEVRENGGGVCSASVVELMPITSGAVQYVPVAPTSCAKIQ
ncbi:hypothetical protein [Dyella choica]|uniref:DUF2846 domain-containing protein n=1 Tax=Dyella choica TaxID=1927959 RepID=A0A432LZS6_9GAMM|nr:hypothetical protein [Dyella choica]RUL69439.1 hypothetical protein EKH80_22455 [Dyella choica]